MDIKNKINKTISKIRNFYLSLNESKKIIVLLFIVIMLFIIVKLISLFNKNTKYNNIDISSDYYVSQKVKDNNLYVTLKDISSDFLTKESQYNSDNKKIKLNDIYVSIISTDYKKELKKSDFKKMYNNVVEKYNRLIYQKGEAIPNGIVYDGNGNYIVKYSLEDSNLYVGITLDIYNEKYYIWYME